MLGFNAFAGTVGAYTNLMKLQTKWATKQEEKTYTEKSDQQEDPIIRQLEEMRENKQENCSKEAILNKLNSGKKLSHEELEYLQKEDPATYQKAKEIQAERASYERSLKNCKTKEDVQRLKATHLGAAMTKVNAIANNPNIPKGKKMELLLHENAKLNAVNKVERAFVASNEYNNLPTDAERKEEMKQAQEQLEERIQSTATEEIPAGTEGEPAEADPREDEIHSEQLSEEYEAAKGAVPEEQKSHEVHKTLKPHKAQEQKKAALHTEEQGRESHKAYAKGRDSYKNAASDNIPKRRKPKLNKNA